MKLKEYTNTDNKQALLESNNPEPSQNHQNAFQVLVSESQ